MNITVNLLDGTRHILTVNPQDTVGSLKTRIQAELGVPVQKQKLVHSNGHGTILGRRPIFRRKTTLSDDSRLLSSHGLRSGSQLSLLITLPLTIQVFLRNGTGETSAYDIKPDETVADFKAKMEIREGVPVRHQRLVHQSWQLEGGRMSDYGVKEMSTIEMMVRMIGG